MHARAQVDMAGYARRAVYSADERRRLMLEIELVPGAFARPDAKRVVFCMCNPSTATEAPPPEGNDPTVGRCITFARAFGGEILVVVNVFDWRAAEPKDMKAAAEPAGPAADAAIIGACLDRPHLVIAAWGANGKHQGRGYEVHALLVGLGVTLYWLYDPTLFARKGKFPTTAPHHPLYMHSACTPLELKIGSY